MSGSNTSNFLDVPGTISTGSLDPITESVLPTASSNTALPPHLTQQLRRDFETIQKAHPELSPEVCSYIIQRKIAGVLQNIMPRGKGQGARISNSAITRGGINSVIGQGKRIQAQPLSRTESCPLPTAAIEKGPMMKRQYSCIGPSTFGNTSQNLSAMSPYDMASILPNSYGVEGLPVEHIPQPAAQVALTPYHPLAIEGYVKQNPRDEPFSILSGKEWAHEFGDGNQNLLPSFPSLEYNLCPTTIPGQSLQISPSIPTFPPNRMPLASSFGWSPAVTRYPASFAAPRMEAQLSTSTFFESVSTNVESFEDMVAFDSAGGLDGLSDLSNMNIMSDCQQLLTGSRGMHENATLQQSYHRPGGLGQIYTGHYPQSNVTDVPDLTDTIETPSTPAIMSRQVSYAPYPTNDPAFGAVDLAERQWSDTFSPPMAQGCQGSPPSSARLRKRIRKPLAEDMSLLLKGTGQGPDAFMEFGDDTNSATSDVFPMWKTFSGLHPPVGPDMTELYENDELDIGLPTKFRKIDESIVETGDFLLTQNSSAPQTQAPTLKKFGDDRLATTTTRPLPALDPDFHARGRLSVLSNTLPPNSKQMPTNTTPNSATTTGSNVVVENTGTPLVTDPTHLPTGTNNSNGSKPPPTTVNPLPSKRYERRSQPKIQCPKCNAVPEGFRGDHELRRHMDNYHNATRKVFVTVDISPNKDFLSNCKSCRRGKYYNVDYNAAAHLRRQHFCKEGKRGKSRKGQEEGRKANIEHVKKKLDEWGIQWREDVDGGVSNSSGGNGLGAASRGNGGGRMEEFSMRFLRKWMTQIELPRKRKESTSASGDDAIDYSDDDREDCEDGSGVGEEEDVESTPERVNKNSASLKNTKSQPTIRVSECQSSNSVISKESLGSGFHSFDGGCVELEAQQGVSDINRHVSLAGAFPVLGQQPPGPDYFSAAAQQTVPTFTPSDIEMLAEVERLDQSALLSSDIGGTGAMMDPTTMSMAFGYGAMIG